MKMLKTKNGEKKQASVSEHVSMARMPTKKWNANWITMVDCLSGRRSNGYVDNNICFMLDSEMKMSIAK